MTSLHCHTLSVDQLSLVVSIIPIWISPAFLNIFGRKLLDIIRIGYMHDQNVHFLERDYP